MIKYNFITSTAFEGQDFWDKTGKTYIVSDGRLGHTKLDISAHKDRQRLREFLSYKYEVGDIITNKSLKQDLISAYNLLALVGKPKLTDINLAYKTAPTSILVSGKKENAVKIVAFL